MDRGPWAAAERTPRDDCKMQYRVEALIMSRADNAHFNERIVSRAHQEEKSVLAGVEGALDHNPLDEPREVRLWALYRWGKEFHEAPLVILSRGGEQRGRGKG